MTAAPERLALAFARGRRAVSRMAEYLLFPVIAVVLLGVVWGTTLHLIRLEREVASRTAATTTAELADTYEAQVVRALREIDQTLKLVRFAHANAGRVDLDELKGKGLLPPDLVFVISIADARGEIVASTRPGILRNVAGDRFFGDLRARDLVTVSLPEPDPRDKEPRLHFGRRLDAWDGSFEGAAIVSVASSYFVSGYESSKLGQQGVLALLGIDGVFRARRTGDKLFAGDSTDYASMIASASTDAARIATSPWDRVSRYTIVREIFDFPLAVVIGLSEREEMTPVDERTRNYVWRAAGGSLLLLLFLVALGGLSWQLTRTRLRANRALEEEVAIRRKAEVALNLRNRAIESSVNAIIIMDVRRPGYPIEYVNPAFERITGYGSGEVLGRETRSLLGSDTEQAGVNDIEHAMREQREGHAVLRNYRKDGSLFWNEFYAAPVRNERGEVTHYVGVMNDVTEAKVYEEQLAHQANFDALTGLANRNLLQDRLQQAIVTARREGRTVATVFLDVDHFKLVNDTFGHRVGDELLQKVAVRLRSCVRESDTVARLGGDEFVLVLQARADSESGSLESDITAVMHKLLTNVSLPLWLGNRQIRPTCSIGVSIYPQDGDSADTLLRNADAAMYRAKELGRNRFQLFTAEVHERIRRRMELESSLRTALEREEFELHYQPQVSLRSGAIVGIEALLRWRHPEKGLIGPANFVPFAEETGLIVPIGAWVMRAACKQNKAWQDAGLPRIPIAVNMSAKQCEQEDLERVVREALEESGLDARYLELEITESISMANPDQSVPLMRRLKAMGIALSIDDFGTGFSNLSYLPRFPVDRLKIDLSFVRDLVKDPGSLAISEAIITMSHSLQLQVIAEGVENVQQLELLGARHCDTIQGYLFSPPLAASALADLLREGKRLDYQPPPRIGTRARLM